MNNYYCWRCKTEMPFLDEEEWKEIEPLLKQSIEAIKSYRELNDCDLKTAKLEVTDVTSIKFETITGVKGISFETISHHRLSDWGEECPKCSHLFRSPKAKFCTNCGYEK